MTPEQIKDKFRDVFNGNPNPLTPTIIRYGRRHKYLYELASGQGLACETIYGVTVLADDKCATDISRCFSCFNDAENYITNLGKMSRAELRADKAREKLMQ